MSEKESIGYWDGSDKPSVVASRHWGPGPVPPNTLRNQDGTPYRAGGDLDEGKIDVRIAERVNGREVLHDVLYLTPAQALYLLTYLEQHRSALEEARAK